MCQRWQTCICSIEGLTHACAGAHDAYVLMHSVCQRAVHMPGCMPFCQHVPRCLTLFGDVTHRLCACEHACTLQHPVTRLTWNATSSWHCFHAYVWQVGKGKRAYEDAKRLVKRWGHFQLAWAEVSELSDRGGQSDGAEVYICSLPADRWYEHRSVNGQRTAASVCVLG